MTRRTMMHMVGGVALLACLTGSLSVHAATVSAASGKGAPLALPAGLRAALVHLGRGAVGGAQRSTLSVPGLRSSALRPSCACGGGGGGGTPWGQQAELVTAPAGMTYFGEAVALSSDGNTALIGAFRSNNYTGAAYVFMRSGSSWVQVAKLTAADAASGDEFGFSVALSSNGSTLLVGAHYHNGGKGAAYVFVPKPFWGYGQQAELTAADGIGFGSSVALSGDGSTALIGGFGHNGPIGAAFAFVRSGTTWAQQQELTPTDGASGDYFGFSLALSSDGNTALIGAPWKAAGKGAAYVFGRSGTTWSQQAELTASDGHYSDLFGSSVALNSMTSSGTTALIGAPGKNNYSGAAYVFVPFFGWKQEAELTAADVWPAVQFGSSVALSNGNTALIGAGGFSNGYPGAAYVFQGSWSSWAQAAKLTAGDGASGDEFGLSVALSSDGNTALIGAPNTNAAAGAAYIF